MCQFSNILLHYYWKEVSKIQSLFNTGSWFHPEGHPQKLGWNRFAWTEVSESPGQFLASSLSFFIYLYYTNLLHTFFPFFFFWFFLCKVQCPFSLSPLPFLFCPQLFCQSSCCLCCWSAPQVPLSPQTIPFLSQHPFWVFEIILSLYFPSSVPLSIVFHVTIFSPSYLLYRVPHSPSLSGMPSSMPLHAFSSSWGLSLWRPPSHSPLPPPKLSALSCAFFGCFQSWVPHPAVLYVSHQNISSCFDGAGTHVAEDVRPVRSEWLSGGLLLCWSVGVTSHPDTGNLCQSQKAQGSTDSRYTGRGLFVMEVILAD